MKKNIYFVQAGMTYDKAIYLPYASGCLAAFAWQDMLVQKEYEVAEFLFRHEAVDVAFAKIKEPFMVAFSCFIWNFEYNKVLAKMIKEKYPECLIVFGGHNVPNDFSILESFDFVDILFHSESEEPFLALLKALTLGKSLDTVPNMSFRQTEEKLFRTETVYYNSVESYPSPYLLGLFDKYIKEGQADEFCYIIETNRGCPYHCAYCDWCFSTKLKLFPMERIKKEIEWFAAQKAEYIFCADANFGILERDLEIAQWVIDVKKRTGYPLIFNGCYAKNSDDIVFKISTLLFNNKANKAATLAYQSLNVTALENVNRKNFTMESFSNLLQRYNEAGIPTYTEMILGLPGETYESFCQGLCELIEAGQHSNSTVYACQVYCNSLLGQKELQKKYGIEVAHMPINYIRFLPPQKDEIQEYMDLIVATNTMSREQMANAMIFCTCLQCFHHIGLLRCFAVYLRHENNVSYLDFYNRLLEYIFSANGTLMNEVFVRLSEMCADCTSGEWTYFNKRFSDTGWFLEEGAFLELIYEHERFWDEVKPFLDSFDIDKDVYSELLYYQQSIIRMPNQNTVELCLNYDYYSYFLDIFANKYKPLKKIKNKLLIEVNADITSWKDYAKLVMLYAKRRGDTVITNAKNNVRLEYIK